MRLREAVVAFCIGDRAIAVPVVVVPLDELLLLA
jgi:hypothetical protein